MHELSLAENLMDVLREQALSQGFTRVEEVHLEVGRLAGVELEALRFAWDSVRRDTLAADATLTISELPGRARCAGCGTEAEIQSRWDGCPACGDPRLTVVAGDRMRIKDLLVR